MALEDLRNAKSKALVVDDGEDAVQKALKRFEEALEKEESLRSIVPGVVRIVPPSAGNEQEEQARVAAKQMLGKDTFLGASKKSEGGGRLPTAALAILAVIGVSMVGLLVFLSLDPMTSNSLLNTVGGSDGNFL